MTYSMAAYANSRPAAITDAHVEALGVTGVRILRYGLVLLLLMWGAAKFAAFEAEAIKPLIEHSPFLSWLYGVFGFRGTSALFGIFEMTAGVLIATCKWLPRASGYASLGVAAMFVVTLSFLVTTPGVLEPTNPMGGFLMKDIILLGAAFVIAAEAFGAAKSKN
jgi:reactive chlorine resistance protein C